MPEAKVKDPKRRRAKCPRCDRNTTVGVLERFTGVCSECQAWTRWGFRETLAAIPEEVEELVRQAILDKPTLDLAASDMKKKHPLEHPMREWSPALIVLVDERRRGREERSRRTHRVA